MSEIMGRFAPSPSGRMHLGNLFSALLAWLSIRSQGGGIMLRMEDLDTQRCKSEYAEQIITDLKWLGLDWDEGGNFEPYLQSRRAGVYEMEFNRLRDMGLVYPCYCSRASLHSASAPHGSSPVYSGVCRNMSRQERESQTREPAWRLMVPDKRIAFVDGCLGHNSQNLARDCGDFIIRRSDGVFAYQLAVVIDDALLGVNEVVRGCDLLDSTPRQVYINQLLGFPIPNYYHVPLLVDSTGRRLSKRDRDLDMGKLQKRFTAPQIVGKLAHLAGLIPTPEEVTPKELIPQFQWTHIKTGSIVVDEL